MAFTVSSIAKSVMGNLRVTILNITPDSAEGTVQVPGIGKVVACIPAIIGGTASATCLTVKENLGTTATVIAGALGLSGCASGDIYRFVVYGTS